MFNESNARSFVKMFTWRVIATLVTALLVLVITGRKEIALTVGGLDILLKSMLYYAHERLWNRTELGRSRCG